MVSISIRFPEDVLEDLKGVAPLLGFSGYQSLIRAYIGQGLRKDLASLEGDPLKRLTDSLRRQGVAEEVIAEAVREARARPYATAGDLYLDRVCETATPYGVEEETPQ